MNVTWWGGWPWRWRFYLVRRSKWGPFGELLLGPVGFSWPTDRERKRTKGKADERPFGVGASLINARAEKAEAEQELLRAQRDAYILALAAAEADAQKLRDALEAIAECAEERDFIVSMRGISLTARAALAGSVAEETP